MAIPSTNDLMHWNYFLALEQDLARISRFIEFDSKNYQVFSIELAHLLLASASEVDVLLKAICERHGLTKEQPRITDYRKVVQECLPHLIREEYQYPNTA